MPVFSWRETYRCSCVSNGSVSREEDRGDLELHFDFGACFIEAKDQDKKGL